MMNPSFLERSPSPDPRQDTLHDTEHPTLDQFVTIDSSRPYQHHQHQPQEQLQQQQHQRAPVSPPLTNQSQQQHSSMTTLPPHGVAAAHSTTLMNPQSRWQGHQGHHYLVQAQQSQPPLMQHQQIYGQQQRQQYQQQQPHPTQQHTDLQQRHQQQQQQQQQHHHHHHLIQRGAAQSLSVPRTVSTPAWISSGANAAMHQHPHPANINTAAASAAAVDPSAPSSSSSSGSLLSHWDHSAASDSELAMTSAMASGDVHHSMSELPASVGGIARHRYTSSATSLSALSPTGVLGGGSHSSSSHMGSAASSYGHMTGGASDHYHGYAARPASMSLSTQQPYGYQAAHQHASGMAGSLVYPSSVSAPLTSPGLVYGSSSSSTQLSGGGYDAYHQPSFSPQYVSYLPPSLHDSRFYPLNPFEIKHRRRTTKTQFRVLESTFREVPKPNATLRKQISAQLDMPVRAVQIWFQNRRAKAKAMEKKRTGGGGGAAQGGGGGGSGDGEVGVAGTSAVGERARVQSGGMTGGGHPGYSEAGEQRYYDEDSRGAAGGAASTGFDHGINRPTSRSMDLPPLRNVDQLRSGDNYTTTSSTTAPALPPIESRDRRPPSLASSMTMHPASTLSLASGSTGGASSHATYSDEQAGIPRAGAAPTGLTGPAANAGATNEGAHHTESGSLLAVGGLSSTFDRPASRLSNLAPPALPSPSSRSFTDDHSNRFWSSTQQ